MKKKVLSIALALLMALTLLPFGASAVSGTVGDNLTWKLLSEGLFIIEGEGDMIDFMPGQQPWADFTNLGYISIETGVTSIGMNAFREKKTDGVNISETVKSIGAYAFYASGLPKLEIPGTVKNIGAYAFAECQNLTQVSISKGVTTIAESMFANDENLKTITIPTTVKRIDINAFYMCGDLRQVQYKGTCEQWKAIEIADLDGGNSVLASVVIRCKDGNLNSPAPIIASDPQIISATEGETATFSVIAIGDDLTYQWQYKKAGYSTWYNAKSTGNKTATLTVEATAARNGMQFRCVVKNSGGEVISDPSTLSVILKPVVSTQPKDVSVKLGATAKFTVKASGSDLTYQWQYKKAGYSTWYNSTSEGNKTATLTVEGTTARNGMQFRCVVKNAAGKVISNPATLTVTTTPEITTQPKNKTAAVGDSVQFTVKATGGDLTYQWQYKKAGYSTWYNSTSAGNKTATLTVEATAARNGMQFRCVVKNANGSVISSPATLKVQ